MRQTARYVSLDLHKRTQLLEVVCDRFGISPEVFDGYAFFQGGRRYVMVATVAPGDVPVRESASIGVPFMRVNLPYPKLTTGAVMTFGSYATRNLVDLSIPEAREFVRRRAVLLDASRMARCTGKGYVIVQRRNVVIGLGFVDPKRHGAYLKSLYPGRWSPGP